jgi:hypothetical protein
MLTVTERIRALNDKLRTTSDGGKIVLTRSRAVLGLDVVAVVFAAVQTFSSFTPANDPHGEHDFGLLEACKQQVMFKIDYYNLKLSGHASAASDPPVTRRVLTIMRAEKY